MARDNSLSILQRLLTFPPTDCIIEIINNAMKIRDTLKLKIINIKKKKEGKPKAPITTTKNSLSKKDALEILAGCIERMKLQE
jgi:hypothetical protein